MFSTMTTWMQVVGAAAGVGKMSSILLEHGMKDVQPEEDTIKVSF